MPVYEFTCEICGLFERTSNFSETGGSAPCPECDTPARRVYSMPGVVSVSAATRKARAINERGSEPKIARKPKDAARPRPGQGGGRPWQINH